MNTLAAPAERVLDAERREFEARTPRSRERFGRALKVLPGGDTRAATR